MSTTWNLMRRAIRNWVSLYPSIYLPLVRHIRPEFVIGRDTELVIEGFPRSGNSFAEAALRWSQPRALRLAHHCHAAAQVIEAARKNVPCIVLVRDPADAVASLLLAQPSKFTPKSALTEYKMFYEAIRPVRGRYVLADFRAVTGDFGKVLAVTNEKYGTRFRTFTTDESVTREIFTLLDETSVARETVAGKSEPYSPFRTSGETALRAAKKNEVKHALLGSGIAELLGSCRDMYASLLEHADVR